MKEVSSIHAGIPELPSHYRPRQRAAVWQKAPQDWAQRLAQSVDKIQGNYHPVVFFRADDIGAGGKAFDALCRLFRYHEVPLGMAVVPAWLSPTRIEQLFRTADRDHPLWSWHQHGWRHVNWQRTAKKSEFGQQRPFEKQWRDLWQGKQKMAEVFGDRFVPVFTPPWNRLSLSTLKILQELNFRGVSMTDPLPRGSKTPIELKNLRIQLDLHTRKAQDGLADYQNLLEELSSLLEKKEPLGIMIHHQRMTLFAFEFLNELLYVLKHRIQAQFPSFQKLLFVKESTKEEDKL